VAVLLFFPVLVGLLLVTGRLIQTTGPRRPASLSAMTSADVSARRLGVQRSMLELVRHALLVGQAAPALGVVRLSRARAALVLVPRPRPYGVADLLSIPEAATRTAAGTVLFRLPVVVPPEASLVIDSSQATVLQLLSSPSGFAGLVGLGGTIELLGSAGTPLSITTLDPGTGGEDQNLDDGRGFVLESEGRMDLSYVRAEGLGFGYGAVSGVAWAGTTRAVARGTVTHSRFTGNRYGAYTFRATGMTWTDNSFAYNQVYGLALHDFSTHFVVRNNHAVHNGRHGFMLSRGCDENVLDNNRSESNDGDGFVVNSAPIEGNALASAVQSSGNVLSGNTAAGNGPAGIAVEGGRSTVVRGNQVSDNQVGVRYGATATGTVEDNAFLRNRLFGVQIEASAGAVTLRRNTASGSWSDLMAARPVERSGNHFDVAQVRDLTGGHGLLEAPLTAVAGFVEIRPALGAWLIMILVPLAVRTVTWPRAVRTRRRARPSLSPDPPLRLRDRD
jgi:parallel beta-helix repeat protein